MVDVYKRQEYIHGKDVDSCVGDVADMRIEAQGKAEFFDMRCV